MLVVVRGMVMGAWYVYLFVECYMYSANLLFFFSRVEDLNLDGLVGAFI